MLRRETLKLGKNLKVTHHTVNLWETLCVHTPGQSPCKLGMCVRLLLDQVPTSISQLERGLQTLLDTIQQKAL